MRKMIVLLVFALVASACGTESEAMEGSAEPMVPEAAEETAATSSPAPRAEPAPAPRPAPAARVVPAGTVLVFEVLEDVSTSSHRAGDSFRLRLVDGVSGSGGAMIAAGSEAVAVVTEARRSSNPDEEAVLDFRLQSVQGRALQATVESANIDASARDSDTRTAAKIATGAAAGAVVGQILGRNTRSTVAGAAAGAVAGTGVALTTRGGDAVLPRGSTITTRLGAPITVD